MPLQKLFITHSNIHNYGTRNRLNPRKGEYVGNVTEKSFIVKGPQIWSEIPDAIKSCDTLKVFSNKRKIWLMN